VLARLSKSSEACRGTQVPMGGWVYIYSFTHNLEDFECQPVCRPTSKALKRACDYMYPVGYIVYYILENSFCQDFCQLLPQIYIYCC
jgi:hypothetical protein